MPGDSDINEARHLQLIGSASTYCQQKRAFLLIDAPLSWSNNNRPVATSLEVNALRSLVVNDYSAGFYPRVQYLDAGLKKFIGPSGMIAGLMARIDASRGLG